MNAELFWNAGPDYGLDGGYLCVNAILANVVRDSRRPGTVQSLYGLAKVRY